VPNSANFDDQHVDCKTNPTPRRPLTDVQLAVARWIVAGYGSSAIARRLGLNHHTIARWKRDPRVVAVIEQLRARADAAVVAMVARNAATAAGGSPRS
jgi:DNA-binding NarL/FixJ family response regulator